MRMSNSSVSSPFWDSGSWFFFFPVRAFRFSRKNFAPGCSRNDDSCLPRPTASPVLLAWSGAQPCGARRAKRLGRSGGLGQQRARYCGRQLGGSLLRLAAGRLMPRMVCRRRPLPFLDGNRHVRARVAGRRIENLRLRGRGDLSPSQRAASVLDGDAAVPPFAHQHFALGWRVVATLPLELEPVVISHHPVVADGALALQPLRELLLHVWLGVSSGDRRTVPGR